MEHLSILPFAFSLGQVSFLCFYRLPLMSHFSLALNVIGKSVVSLNKPSEDKDNKLQLKSIQFPTKDEFFVLSAQRPRNTDTNYKINQIRRIKFKLSYFRVQAIHCAKPNLIRSTFPRRKFYTSE